MSGNNPGKALHPSAIYRIVQCDAPDPGFRQIWPWGPEFLVSGNTVSTSYQEGCESRVYFSTMKADGAEQYGEARATPDELLISGGVVVRQLPAA